MQLFHFSAAAHVVHQVVGVPFSADKSHALTSKTHRAGVVYLPSTTPSTFRCRNGRKSVLKVMFPNLLSFPHGGSSLFPLRFIRFADGIRPIGRLSLYRTRIPVF